MENGKWKIYYKDSVVSLSNLVLLSKVICSCLLSVFSGSASSASFTNKFKGSNLNTKITEIRMNGSSHQRCSLKNIFLRNSAKLTKKHLCQSLFFNKVAGVRAATVLKKRLWHRCFPVSLAKFQKYQISNFKHFKKYKFLTKHFREAASEWTN